MKSVILIITFISVSLFSRAQSLDEIMKMINSSDFKNAKTSIDSYLADAKNTKSSDAWYFKGRIYNSLSYDNSVTSDLRSTYKTVAYDAFKKSQELDPKDFRLKMEAHKSYLDLYFGFYDLGANQFNERKYNDAFNAFVKALEIKDFILARKYIYPEATIYPLDTALILNAAIAASQAKKDDVAITYYKKLIDANVAGKNYQEVYEFLVTYYNDKEDQTNLQPILAKAKMFYPDNDYWTELEIRAVAKTGDQAALFAKYEDVIAKKPGNFTLNYNYAVEIYNSIYGRDAKPSTDEQKAKLTSVLKTAIANDKGNDALLLMVNHLYNHSSDLSIAASLIKGTKPEDIKKKKDLVAASNKVMDELIPYGESAIKYFDDQATLKPVQKANYRVVLGHMSDAYNAKKDVKKAAEYEKRKDSLN